VFSSVASASQFIADDAGEVADLLRHVIVAIKEGK